MTELFIHFEFLHKVFTAFLIITSENKVIIADVTSIIKPNAMFIRPQIVNAIQRFELNIS